MLEQQTYYRNIVNLADGRRCVVWTGGDDELETRRAAEDWITATGCAPCEIRSIVLNGYRTLAGPPRNTRPE